MYEKVSLKHPDKIADRIAGALVDLSYKKQENPKVAIEVLIGHGECFILNETSCPLDYKEVEKIVKRIDNSILLITYREGPQDEHLADNQKSEFRCGDNGIFRGVPVTNEQKLLVKIVKDLYHKWPSDGKYILSQKESKLIICQSNAQSKDIEKFIKKQYNLDAVINPLGEWTGGTNVDCGATNRKLGSDMADSCTGGGLHGKDLTKGDVSINIYAFLKAQETNRIVEITCAIGDTKVDGRPYKEIIEIARDYIKSIGGFEKLAEYGTVR